MKPKAKLKKLQRRIAAWKQRNFDGGPAKRWRSGGYHCHGARK